MLLTATAGKCNLCLPEAAAWNAWHVVLACSPVTRPSGCSCGRQCALVRGCCKPGKGCARPCHPSNANWQMLLHSARPGACS